MIHYFFVNSSVVGLLPFVGSASIAQVHYLTLKNGGGKVAVKVQHEGMKRKMMADLANFQLLATLLERTELNVDLSHPVQEMRRQITRELDFSQVVHAMSPIVASLRHLKHVTVPEPLDHVSSKRLLVM